MSEIDWSNAPEGAEFYCPKVYGYYEGWVKQREDGVYGFCHFGKNSWAWGCGNSHLSRPGVIHKPAWTGAGLPPVGAEVECSYACEDFLKWHEGICIAVGSDPEGREICVVQSGETLANYRSEAGRVRPRRTKAQIEAEEREEFAHRLIEEMGKSPTGYPNAMNRARKIYDLGYRKQGEAK